MVDPISTLIAIVVAVGIPVLAVVFYLDGLVVGKVLQPPVMFVAYVTVAAPRRLTLLVAALVCIGAASAGQWTLYRGFDEESEELVGIRRWIPYLESVPERVQRKIGERRMGRLNRQFDRYGGWAVCATNGVPGIRGLMTVPAGLSAYPVRRFLLASTVGNALYVTVLFAAAWGLLGIGAYVI